jgi:hypothetical protein
VDVDACAALRVGSDERHLERREVDHVGDPVLVEGASDRSGVCDVALHEPDARPLGVRQHEPQPRVVGAEVEADRLLA